MLSSNILRPFGVPVPALCALATLGCGSGAEPSESGRTASVAQGVVGQDEFLYFRCNATSWGVDASSRLQATSSPDTFTLTYEVTEPWMVTGGDNCTLTRTNALDGWGSQQSHFGLREGFSPLVVPDAAPLSGNTQSMTVIYPELGDYTVSVNFASGTITIAPAGPTPEAAASANADRFYAYLMARFGWDGIDGMGAAAPIVFTPSPANNAQWTGATLVIGDADGIRSDSFAFSADMIAHELVHAVATHTAGLYPFGEPGAVNESFADVIAVFAGATDGVADWQLGEEVWTPAIPGDALRNIGDPHLGYHRETLGACQFDPEEPLVCGQARHLREYVNVPGSGSEHVNQGILNRAAYLLVEGGTEEGITVSGIGVAKAEQIYFRALTQHLPDRPTFPDVRHLTGAACAALIGQHGITASDCDAVDAAFAAVGIPAPDLNAPAGISGRVTQNGLPVVAPVSLIAQGEGSPAISTLEILQTTTDAQGNYHFSAQDIAAALAPPVPQVDVIFQVRYRNPDPTDPLRVAEWNTAFFDERTYAPGTEVPSFDIAGLAPLALDGDVASLPVTFTWTHRIAEREYYRWSTSIGRESPANIHPTPSLVVTEDNVGTLGGASAFASLSEWSVGIRSYAGDGITNAVPID